MISDYLEMLQEIENLEDAIEHLRYRGVDYMERLLVYVHGVDHPLIAAIHEGSHDVEDEEALSELMEAQILYLEAQKKVLEVQVKYTERGLMLMKDQLALDDDAPDFIKLWKSHE